MIFAYFGPETVLPLTSTLAAVGGVGLMFGKQSFRFTAMIVMGGVRWFSRKTRDENAGVARPRHSSLRADRPSLPRPSQPVPNRNRVDV